MNAVEAMINMSPVGMLKTLTVEQRVSCIKVIEYQGVDSLVKVYPPGGICNPHVGLQFEHIFIGVEPDGYAHS